MVNRFPCGIDDYRIKYKLVDVWPEMLFATEWT
jgi:hypothetical protein